MDCPGRIPASFNKGKSPLKMLKNKKFKELAKQYIDKYSLNLEGLNVLVPVIEQEPLLAGIISGMAGAGNIYMFDPKLNINRDTAFEEFGFNIKFVGSISTDLLAGLNIILKNSQIPLKADKIGCFAKKSSVISMFPETPDFINPKNVEPEILAQKEVSIIGLGPGDPKLGIYQRFSHMIIKKCYSLGIDVYRSRLLLAGNGDFLNCALSLLKSVGAVVYTYNTNSTADQSYVLKHLKGLDAIIVMDYPETDRQIIGSKGVISISDIVDVCPLVKVIHISGKTEIASLKLGNISYFPENAGHDSMSIKINDLGERAITELAVTSLKIAEDFLKSGKNSLLSSESVVTYKLLNQTSLLLGGRI